MRLIDAETVAVACELVAAKHTDDPRYAVITEFVTNVLLNDSDPVACRDCRFWSGDPDGAGVYTCRVRGSFTCAPGALRTEADFGCVHFAPVSN